MQKLNVPFARPCFSADDIQELKEKLELILRSGQLTSGPFVKEFEREFAQAIGVSQSVAVNSATAGLLTALRALGIGPGCEVIVPSNTFVATAGVVFQAGAKPVLADCDIDTFNISPESVRKKIKPNTKALIAVHIAGNPCEMRELKEICEANNLKLIEDCAHAHGASVDGIHCGTFGQIACFSFYPSKLITTGEGGMVVTNDLDLAEKARILRNHGRAGFGPVDVVEVGYNFRMTEIAAAIGLSQLAHLDDFVRERNLLAEGYSEKIGQIGGWIPQRVEEHSVCSYYAYILMSNDDSRISRENMVKELSAKGIETSVIYHPVHLQPAYKAFVSEEERKTLRNSELIGEKSLALPMYNGMGKSDVSLVVDAMAEVMKLG